MLIISTGRTYIVKMAKRLSTACGYSSINFPTDSEWEVIDSRTRTDTFGERKKQFFVTNQNGNAYWLWEFQLMEMFKAKPVGPKKVQEFKAVVNNNHEYMGQKTLSTKKLSLAKQFLKTHGGGGIVQARINNRWVNILDYNIENGFTRHKQGYDENATYIITEKVAS